MVEKIIKMISNLKILSKMNEIIDGLNTHTTNKNNPHNVTAEQLGLATAYVYKGSVTNFSDLPTNAQNGWVYSVENEHTDSSGVVHPAGANFAWDGSKWDDLGGSLSGYATIDFVENRVIPIEKGGTGATTVAEARANLGLETTIGVTPIEKGGTGATTAENARKNLGIKDIATYDVLPIANGGTGQTTAADVIKALFGSSAIGSASQSIYYDGTNIKAGSYNFRLSHNTSDTWIPVFSDGNIDYVLKNEIASAWTGGGIVAASLNTNGYVKFANGLILQWGYCTGYTNNKIPFPITFSAVHCVVSQMCAIGFGLPDGYGRDPHYVTTSGFQTVTAPSTSYPVGWIAIGK